MSRPISLRKTSTHVLWQNGLHSQHHCPVICSLAKIITLQTLAHTICSISLHGMLTKQTVWWSVAFAIKVIKQRAEIYIKHLSNDKRAHGPVSLDKKPCLAFWHKWSNLNRECDSFIALLRILRFFDCFNVKQDKRLKLCHMIMVSTTHAGEGALHQP